MWSFTNMSVIDNGTFWHPQSENITFQTVLYNLTLREILKLTLLPSRKYWEFFFVILSENCLASFYSSLHLAICCINEQISEQKNKVRYSALLNIKVLAETGYSCVRNCHQNKNQLAVANCAYLSDHCLALTFFRFIVCIKAKLNIDNASIHFVGFNDRFRLLTLSGKFFSKPVLET